jgi:acetyl-CoA carboxylase biotin carboxyl carrier protein
MLAGATIQYRGYTSSKAGYRQENFQLITIHAKAEYNMSREIRSVVTGTVYQIEVAAGEQVKLGADLIILESMKMEIPIVAETDGTVIEVRCNEGDSVIEGQVLLMVDPD